MFSVLPLDAVHVWVEDCHAKLFVDELLGSHFGEVKEEAPRSPHLINTVHQNFVSSAFEPTNVLNEHVVAHPVIKNKAGFFAVRLEAGICHRQNHRHLVVDETESEEER